MHLTTIFVTSQRRETNHTDTLVSPIPVHIGLQGRSPLQSTLRTCCNKADCAAALCCKSCRDDCEGVWENPGIPGRDRRPGKTELPAVWSPDDKLKTISRKTSQTADRAEEGKTAAVFGNGQLKDGKSKKTDWLTSL